MMFKKYMPEPVLKEVKPIITYNRGGDVIISCEGAETIYMDVKNAREYIECVQKAIEDIELINGND